MILAAALVATRVAFSQDNEALRPPDNHALPTLFIVGDSTVKNGTRGALGWGEKISELFDRSKIKIQNRAIAGRSSRTFINEGRWDKILADAQPGDFVIIQMGHNDGGRLDDPARARGSLPGTGEETREIDNPVTGKHEVVHTYGWYLRKYVTDAREKGMTPILCSPIPHRPRQPVDAVDPVEKSNFVVWSKQVADTEKVPFVDLNRLISTKYVGMDPAAIKDKYFTPADDTHTSPEGAELNAACVVEGLRKLNECPLASYLAEPKGGGAAAASN
jgi:lysophospholipase L1-like esterase